MRARLAAHAMHAQGKTNTAPARQARWEGYLDEVDPERRLSEDERNTRARHAEQAYMTRLAYERSRKRDAR
jgi:hypothetical protein